MMILKNFGLIFVIKLRVGVRAALQILTLPIMVQFHYPQSWGVAKLVRHGVLIPGCVGSSPTALALSVWSNGYDICPPSRRCGFNSHYGLFVEFVQLERIGDSQSPDTSSNLVLGIQFARVAELADAGDLKSPSLWECGFESHRAQLPQSQWHKRCS